MSGDRESDAPAASPRGDGSPTPLEESLRFAPEPSRRDLLGLAALWTSVGAFGAAAVGALRLPMPSVFPESSSTVKIGSPEAYPPGSETLRPEISAWVFRREEGFSAISTVCTHLGCIVQRVESGEFHCPCHGSKFAADGKVIGGPAPSGLPWLAIELSPDGQVVVDKIRTVAAGTWFAV